MAIKVKGHIIHKRFFVIIALVLVVLLLVFLFNKFTQYSYLIRPVDNNRKDIVGLYAEKRNSLDTIYIGSNSVCGWSPLQAYKDYGITSYSYGMKEMPATAMKNMLVEADKEQSPQLYIIDVSPFMHLASNKEYTEEHIMKLANSLKYSSNRFHMIYTFAEYHLPDMTIRDQVKYHIDMISNAENRSKLTRESHEYQDNDVESKYKGFKIQSYQSTPLTLTKEAGDTGDQASVSPATYETIDNLLEYIKDKDLNVLFTYPPQYITEKTKKIYNTIEKYVRNSGYKFYDSMDDYKDMNIDFSTDFSDESYLNYIGASKYTDYFSDYLTRNYKFEDRRNNNGYKSWEVAHDTYMDDVKQKIYSQGLVRGDKLYSIRPVDENRKGLIGIYAEPKNSLDMVYVGASSVYLSWSPLLAWKSDGIASYSYAVQGMPGSVMKNLIIETEKTQNPKVYVVDVSSLMRITTEKKYSLNHIQRISNGMSYSANRTNALAAIKKYNMTDLTKDQMKDYEFDVYLNAGNADYLTDESLMYSENSEESILKGYRFRTGQKKKMILAPGVTKIKDTTTIDETTYSILDDIMVYAKEHKINLLFTYPPRYIDSKTKAIYNTIEEYVVDEGFDFYDSMDHYDKMNMDFAVDLFDKNHLNYYGSKKYTRYFSKFLKKKYNLPDRSNYDWNDNYKVYKEYIKELDLK